MDNEQYRNLMWHLTYVESLLENAAANTVGGGIVNALCAKQNSLHSVPSAQRRAPMRNARIVNRWNGIA